MKKITKTHVNRFLNCNAKDFEIFDVGLLNNQIVTKKQLKCLIIRNILFGRLYFHNMINAIFLNKMMISP